MNRLDMSEADSSDDQYFFEEWDLDWWQIVLAVLLFLIVVFLLCCTCGLVIGSCCKQSRHPSTQEPLIQREVAQLAEARHHVGYSVDRTMYYTGPLHSHTLPEDMPSAPPWES